MKNVLLSSMLIYILCAQLLYAQWTDIALPAAPGGDVNSLAVKGDKLFAGKPEGIFVSQDNGQHWRKINPHLPARYYNPGLFSIVATDSYIVTAFADKDVYISRDDGEEWFSQELVSSPRTTPYVIAADGDWIICGQTVAKYFNGQSINGGQSWTEYDSIPRPVYSAAIRDSVAFVGTAAGLYRSINFGSDWQKVYDISSTWQDPLPIALSNAKVYLGISAYPGYASIVVSPDNGSSWPGNSPLPCHYINAIVDCPVATDYPFLFAATDSGVFRSEDGGQSWIKKNNGLADDLIFSLAFKEQAMAAAPLLFAGTSNGIFSSSDYGDSWTEIGGPADWLFSKSGSDIYALSSQPIFRGTSKYSYSNSNNGYRTGIIHSASNGGHWDKIYSGYLDRKAHITSLAVNSNNVLFAAGSWFDSVVPGPKNSIVFRSDNGGSEWQPIYIDSVSYMPLLGSQSADVYMNTAYAGGLSRFSDDGDSREILHPLLSPIADMDSIQYPPVSSFNFDGEKIYICGTAKSVIADTRPPKFFLYNVIAYSEDNGKNWTRAKSTLDSITIFNNQQADTLSVISEIYPDGNHIMVAMYAYNFYDLPWYTAYGGGFYHLLYEEGQWVIADTAFSNRSVFAFEANESTFFAATEHGVFSSIDHGANWTAINTGIGNIYVKDLFTSDSYLFASTVNGLWQRPLSEITSIKENATDTKFPEKFSLSQNYPNPFNPLTVINYHLAVSSDVKLVVYDVLGREVKTLIDKKQASGSYRITFKAADLASGIYIYKLQAGSFEQSRKMLLLR